MVEKVLCQKLSGQLANINETSVTRCGPSFETKNYWRFTMLKFLGSTIGIIFLIGLVVVIALFKLVF